jgi:hypothetical protein
LDEVIVRRIYVALNLGGWQLATGNELLATGFWQLAVRSKGNFRVQNMEGIKNRNKLK